MNNENLQNFIKFQEYYKKGLTIKNDELVCAKCARTNSHRFTFYHIPNEKAFFCFEHGFIGYKYVLNRYRRTLLEIMENKNGRR